MQDRQPAQTFDPIFYMKAAATFLVASIVVTIIYAKSDLVQNAVNRAATRFDYHFSSIKGRLFKSANSKSDQVLPKSVPDQLINAATAPIPEASIPDKKPDAVPVTEITLPTRSELNSVLPISQPATTPTPAKDGEDDDEQYVDALKELKQGEKEDKLAAEVTTPPRRFSR